MIYTRAMNIDQFLTGVNEIYEEKFCFGWNFALLIQNSGVSAFKVLLLFCAILTEYLKALNSNISKHLLHFLSQLKGTKAVAKQHVVFM